MRFDTRVCGIPCVVEITHWEPFRQGRMSGPPEDCYPDEGGYGEFELFDRKGRRALWLEKRMTDADHEELDKEMFERMEQGDCDGRWD